MDMVKSRLDQTGEQIASMLAGSWREHSSPPINADVLKKLAPLILANGVAPLVWYRFRNQSCRLPASVAETYHNAYIICAVQAATQRREIERLAATLRNAEIRFILLKGLSIGRLYPQDGLRPAGDVDLWIDPAKRSVAHTVIHDSGISLPLDLDHDQFRRFEDRNFDDFYQSCEDIPVGSSLISILRPEDQLRMLSLHFLKHGGLRAVWLCDIGVLMESCYGRFDWDRCLGANRRRAGWIAAAIQLAQELLDAAIPHGAPPLLKRRSPRWLKNIVLREWASARFPTAALGGVLRSPLRLSKIRAALQGRWRNPIQATIDCDGTFSTMLHRPYQAMDAVRRGISFCWNLRAATPTRAAIK